MTTRGLGTGWMAGCAGMLRVLAVLAAGFVGSLATAQQTTVTLTSVLDNTLYQSTTGATSNGRGTFMFAGLTNNGGATIRRGVLRFDLSSIPAGSTINSASLQLTCSRVNDNTARAHTIHRLTNSWGEGTSDATQGGEGQGIASTTNDATWIHRFFNTQNWTTAGGDFVAGASATTNVGATGNYTWTGATVLADVQGWYTTPATNFGWILRGVENVSGAAKRFNTREFATANQRPILTVVYTPPAPVTGACCVTGTCSILSAAACATAGGTYQGNNTLCTPNPCPQPTGACCTTGVCTVVTQANCTAGGGTYQGNGTVCTPNPCTTATTVTVGASKDNSLYQTATGTLSNGVGQGIVVGTGNQNTLRRRGVLAFDLSAVPANATITSARLRLVLGVNGDTAARTINLHRLTGNWGEGTSNAPQSEFAGATSTTNDATWIHRFFNTQNWITAGGDFVATASASSSVGTTIDTFYEWTSATMAADVQGWLTTPANNFGWLLANANEGTLNTQRRFEGLQNATTTDRPQLVLTYTTPPPTGACCQPDGTCSVLTSAQCTAASGSYSGDGTNCSPNLCPQPTGACCLTSGNCSVVTAAQCAAAGGTYHGNNTPCSGVTCPIILTPFLDALPVPAIATPTTGTAGGAAHYDIGMTEFSQQLHAQLPPTRVWGYAGTSPGPTIEARRGQTVTVNWINNLRTPDGALRTNHPFNINTCFHGPNVTGNAPVTVVHFHGGLVAPHSDGDPDLAFPPGQSSPTYTYPNDQRACTMWYHDHALGITRLNVYMGLAGMYLLRDDVENALNLPRGEFEVPLVIQDRSFNPDGSFKYDTSWHDQFLGQFIMVNGKVWPFMNVKRGKYRFRMVNGSNTRVYTLALSNGATFHQIGTDQGLLPAPVPVTSVTFAPSERLDIVIDFAGLAPGTAVTMTNSAAAPFPQGDPANDVANVMRFVVQATAGDTDPLPATLVSVPPIPESAATATRVWTLRTVQDPECNTDTWMINDLKWSDITDFPRLGSTEIWSFVNRSNFAHPMHVHLVSFQILDRQNVTFVNGEPVPTGPRIPPLPDEAGWKDVVFAQPFQITRIIMTFEGPFTGLYPLHCHILEHEDNEMMRLFNVVCDPPGVTNHPDAQTVETGATVQLSAAVTADAPIYQWTRAGTPLMNGATGLGSTVSGANTTMLQIANAQPGDGGLYSLAVTTPCGATTSTLARVIVGCNVDFNGDGFVEPGDLDAFITNYFSGVPAEEALCDFNGDGIVEPGDLDEFVTAFFSGC
ncbi:MAG: DNRLRE domain-containing protein [Phycisphaerales bacterium]